MRKYFYVEMLDNHAELILAERWYYTRGGKMRIRFVDCEVRKEGRRGCYKFLDYDCLLVKRIYPWREYKPILRAEHLETYVLKKARTFNDCPIPIPAGDALRMNLGNLLDEYHKFDKLCE